MNIIKQINTRRLPLLAALTAVAVLGLTACSTTRQARSVTDSGFLGDYSQLTKGTGDQAQLRYIAPNVDWKKYTKVYIMPVELWKADDKDSPLGKLSPENQQLLVNFFYTELNNELQKSFTIVAAPGPDTLVVHVAVTEAEKSAPVRNLLTSVVPFGIAANILVTAAFGSGIGVGQVQVEGELLDGQTNQRLAAAVDRRVGTKALRTKFDGSWGDVKLAFAYWAFRLEAQLIDFRTGTQNDSKL